MFWEMFARPSSGLAALTCRVFPCRCVWGGGLGSPLAQPRCLRGLTGARGPRRDSPEGGTGGTPARGCRKTILIQKQRPESVRWGPCGWWGNEIWFGKGWRKVSRERNYHHNGGKNVSREKRGGSYSAGIFCLSL